MSINPADVTKAFLTHLHSDHIIALPELYLEPWASQCRSTPLQVWGPDGTRSMMRRLQEALRFDIHFRLDVDEKYSADGIRSSQLTFAKALFHEANGLKVTAFLADHGPVKPAFGSALTIVVTRSSCPETRSPLTTWLGSRKGVDLLIHEVGRSKQDPCWLAHWTNCFRAPARPAAR